MRAAQNADPPSPELTAIANTPQAYWIVPGSSASTVAKYTGDAAAAGARILAVVLGSAINNDGAAKAGFTAPSVEGQSEAIAESLLLAGVDPATLRYVEAHGSGTPLGDPIEVAALARSYEVLHAFISGAAGG